MNRAGHCIFAPWFLLSSSIFLFSRLISAAADWMSATHDVALVRIYDAGLRRATRGSLKIQDAKSRQKSPSGHHRTTLSGYTFATKARIDNRKKLLNINISSTCPHNMVNFGQLEAKVVSLVWGTPANFNGFRVLASLLQRRRLTEASQTLHGVWPSPGLVHYIHTFGGSCPVTEFCQVQHSLCVQVLRFPSGCQPKFVTLSRGRHLYSAGRPSRWALAHILVLMCLCVFSKKHAAFK